MKKIIATIPAVIFCLYSCCQAPLAYEMEDPVDYVSTLVGTMSKHSLSTGNTYPAAGMPWGTDFWTPQTGANGDGWTYSYSADKIVGLRRTHQPSPWINDYGAMSIMPVTKAVHEPSQRASWFSHKAEKATPYSYEVYLADYDVYAELAPTQHACAFRLTYPECEMSYLVVDGYDEGSHIEIVGNNKVVGYVTNNVGGVPDNFKDWFIVESDTEFSVVETDSQTYAMLGFPTSKGQVVNVKVASSFISLGQAEVNMNELSGKDFDTVKAEGRKAWNDVLSRIKVEDTDIDRLRTFYSCLYRSLLFPRDLSEVTADGQRVHYSPHTGDIRDGYFFTDTGFWDTFRCLFPLVNLVYSDMSPKIQEGLVNDWKESGFLPEWASPGHRGCMIGNNSASVVADAYLSGIRGYDAEALWDAVVHGTENVHPQVSSTGRLGHEYYNTLGYVPCNVGINESAARTLEYAYDDWCIWQFGKALGKSEKEIAVYRERALNYRNVYNPEYGLMVGRKEDGGFSLPFSPLKWGGDFTEGNSLHYTWSVFHDPQGLINLMGGDDAFNAQMDGVFEMPPHFDDSYYGFTIHEIREMQIMNMGNYAHGNQPIQHMLYLYDWSGQPWKAQKRIREVMDRFYNAAPDGYCGDEDNGQTSAWYVFSAMGFYPVCPGSGQYAMGTPLFGKMTVTLPNGNTIRIKSEGNGDESFYVKDVKVNGKSVSRCYFTLDELSAGADIVFTMSDTPVTSRGISPEDRPYSMSNGI